MTLFNSSGHHKTQKHPHASNNSSQTKISSSVTTKVPTFKSTFVPKKVTTTTPTTTKGVTITEKKHDQDSDEDNDLLDVGDGRILGNDERSKQKTAAETNDKKDEKEFDEDELGLMTEITTKNNLPEEGIESTESSGDIPIAYNETNSENLSSFANLNMVKFSFPVILAFMVYV